MPRATLMVRLLAAVVVSLAACKLVILYSQMSYIRLKVDHPDAECLYVGTFNQRVIANAPYAYAVPFPLLLGGIVIIWRWPSARAVIELIASALWIFAFVWFGLVLLAWQMQNIPVFVGMQGRYYTPY